MFYKTILPAIQHLCETAFRISIPWHTTHKTRYIWIFICSYVSHLQHWSWRHDTNTTWEKLFIQNPKIFLSVCGHQHLQGKNKISMRATIISLATVSTAAVICASNSWTCQWIIVTDDTLPNCQWIIVTDDTLPNCQWIIVTDDTLPNCQWIIVTDDTLPNYVFMTTNSLISADHRISSCLSCW